MTEAHPIIMKKLFLLLFLSTAMIAHSRQISESYAASIASEFFNSTPAMQKPSQSKMRMVPTRESAETAPFYIFNASDDQGFVIISGDDRARCVIGYSSTGSFDYGNIPPQLADLLNRYADYIGSIPADTPPHSSWKTPVKAESSDDAVILPTAEWGQGAPYNALCPEIDGVRTPTGCVATAMAILMKYHNWPKSYNWNKISNEAEDENEIALLMHDIGKKIHTTYGINESSAYVGPIPQFFYSEFDYDGDCQLISRSNFTDDEYFSYIRTELNNGRPVISFGTSDSTTHCFIFDGYDNNSMLHVNWGWDGVANGFYALDSLIPDSRDFSNYNGIIIGLKPSDSQSIDYSDYAYMDAGYGVDVSCLRSGGGLSMDCDNILTDEWFTVTYNTLNIKSDIRYSFALIDESNNIKEIAEDRVNFIQTPEDVFYPVVMIENKIRFHSEIAENDRLAIVARPDAMSESWKIIRGTIEAPSVIKAIGYNAPTASLIWHLDEDLNVILSHGTERNYYDINTVPVKMLKGTFLDVMIYTDKAGIVILELDNEKYGRDINTYIYTFYQNRNGIGGSIPISNNHYTISAHFIPMEDCEDNLKVDIETPGTLSDILSSDKPIIGLTISGNLNTSDFEFLRTTDERVLYLKKLDLANVSVYDEDGILTNILPEYALSDHGFIQQLVLPDNLQGIGDNALSNLQSLKELDIPKNVTNISANALAWNVLLRKIIVHNPEPFKIDPLAFDEGFFTPDGLILSVPVGALSNYANHTGLWSKFGKIVEGNNRAETMTLKVYRNGKYEVLTEDDLLNYVHAHPISILVEFSPEDAADYFYAWSSNPEYSFPSPGIYFNNEECRFNISDDFTKQEGHSIFFVESSSNLKQSFKVDSYPIFKSISLTPEEIILNKRDVFELTAKTSPEYFTSTPIEWESSDETIAEVNDGMVIAHSPGSAIVTATIRDGSGISATCKVTVKDTITAINDLIIDTEKDTFLIYNLQGICIRRNATQADVDALPAGIYIVNGRKMIVN